MTTRKITSRRPLSLAHLTSFLSIAAAWSAVAVILISSTARAQNLFVSERAAGEIAEITPGGAATNFCSGPPLYYPQGLAFDSAGNLFVGNPGPNQDEDGDIVEITPGGVASTFATGLNYPGGLAFDKAGDLLVADTFSNTIYEYTNCQANGRGVFSTAVAGPYGLAFDSAGNLFATGVGNGNIYEFTDGVATGESTFAMGLSRPQGLAFDSAGDMFVSQSIIPGNNDTIIEYTNCVAAKKGTFAGGLSAPVGLAFDSAGNLYEADYGSGNICKFTNGVANEKGTFAYLGAVNPDFFAFAPPPQLVPFTYTTNNGTITITGYTGTNAAVTIPGTINGYPVTSIGDYAFEVNSLTSVTIPNSVTDIEEGAFFGCTGLTSVTIPNSVTSISDDAFTGSGLTGITIPNSVTNIEYGAFDDCTGLTSVTIPNSVTSIGEDAFAESGLTGVTIPNSVTSIGEEAFGMCASLTNLAVIAGDPDYSSASGVLFNQNQTMLIQFPRGPGGNYTIPNSVTSIDEFAFAGSGLTSVTIPNSVTGIEHDAFDNCSGLTNVIIGSGVTNIGNSAFQGCERLGGVYFLGNAPTPTDDKSVFSFDLEFSPYLTAYYLQGTTGWGATFDGIRTSVIIPPPALGMSTYGGQPAVFFPMATGTNYVLQMTTNLVSGPWVTVSNYIPIIGGIITNPPAAAFFRLH